MFNITNIEEINENFGRNLGTDLIVEVVNTVKKNIASEYIFVRYMGPKFAIAFTGAEVEGVIDFLTDLKNKIEDIKIEERNKKNTKSKIKKVATPKVNFVIATYYKGTGIEEVTKKLEEYLNSCDKTENTITSI